MNLIASAREWAVTGNVPERHAFAMNNDLLRFSAASVDESVRRYKVRQDFIREFGFAVPCNEALSACAKYAPLVEIGAGSGFWTRLLQARGVDCIPTDPLLAYHGTIKHSAHLPNVQLQGKTAVRRFSDRNVLCVWPSYEHTWARQAAKAMRVGRTILAVTECEGGCCAENGFFAVLRQCFVNEGDVRLPQFDGLHDVMEIWRKVRPWRQNADRA